MTRLWRVLVRARGGFRPIFSRYNLCPYSSSAQNATESHRKSIQYLQGLVKRHDYDHYLCNLLLPQAVQAAAFTARAFNVEVAQIHDVITEKHTGLMRIQFWRDLLDSTYKVDVQVEIVLRHQKLSKHWFNRILDAREAELSTATYLSTSDMEEYAENTFSSLLYLTLEAAGVRDVQADHAASHLGKAEGIVTLLRSVPFCRSRRRVLIPMDILLRHGASQEDVLRGEKTSQTLKDAVFDLASLANAHLTKARSLEKHLNRDTKKVLLPSVVCENFLKRIQVTDFDVFSPQLLQRDPKLPAQLLWRTMWRTY